MSLRRVQARFLESCRNLREGRDYWAGLAPWKRWVLRTLTPAPLLSLLPEGRPIAEAIERLERDCRARPLSEEELRRYHRILFPAGGGAYRTSRVEMRGSTARTAAPERVPLLARRLSSRLAELQAGWDVEPPPLEELLRAAMDVYQEIGRIHPFPDGNGRVARLAVNHLTRRYGHPYVILPPLSESPELMAALQEGHAGRLDPLLRLALTRLHPAR